MPDDDNSAEYQRLRSLFDFFKRVEERQNEPQPESKIVDWGSSSVDY
jgi:hypothetical protein